MPHSTRRAFRSIRGPREISHKALKIDCLLIGRQVYNRIGKLLQKNGHIKATPEANQALAILINKLNTFILQPDFNTDANPISDSD